MRETFRRCELNGDDILSLDELKKIFREFDPDGWTDHRMEQIYSDMGVDANCKVKIGQFLDWVFKRDTSTAHSLVGTCNINYGFS